MNYRHAYHAGNFADVMKHLSLCLILDYMTQKEAPFCVLDAHGGTGMYDLSSAAAQKTGEWENGIGHWSGVENIPGDAMLYWDQIAPFLAKGHYPGSPLLAQSLLRKKDRLIANELHPDDKLTLQQMLGRNAYVTQLDAYEFLRGQLPPTERRGVVLIDPPYEKKDEFAILTRQMEAWKARFATGVYLIWYPIKAHLPTDDLKIAVIDLGLPRSWFFETMLHPRTTPDTFNGSGLIILNAPYQVPERLTALCPFLSQTMQLHSTGTGWLVAPT